MDPTTTLTTEEMDILASLSDTPPATLGDLLGWVREDELEERIRQVTVMAVIARTIAPGIPSQLCPLSERALLAGDPVSQALAPQGLRINAGANLPEHDRLLHCARLIAAVRAGDAAEFCYSRVRGFNPVWNYSGGHERTVTVLGWKLKGDWRGWVDDLTQEEFVTRLQSFLEIAGIADTTTLTWDEFELQIQVEREELTEPVLDALRKAELSLLVPRVPQTA